MFKIDEAWFARRPERWGLKKFCWLGEEDGERVLARLVCEGRRQEATAWAMEMYPGDRGVRVSLDILDGRYVAPDQA